MKKTKNQWFANAMPAILSACVTLMVMIPLLLLGAILSRSDWMTETRYNTLGIICLAVFAVILLCLFGGLIAVRRYKKSKEKSEATKPHWICADCGNEITDVMVGNNKYKAETIISTSQRRHGLNLCATCLTARRANGNEGS